MPSSTLFAVFLLHLVTQVRGIDITVKGDKCSHLDLCSKTEGGAFRTCACYEDCYKYRTCCVDAENFPLMASEEQEYHCFDDKVTTPVFAKRTCAKNFEKHVEHITACQADGDKRDVFGNLLVTSSKTSITYWNKDCAICNNEDENNLVPWTVQVICPKTYEGTSISQSYIRKNLTFDWDAEEWGIIIKDEFVNCSISMYKPHVAIGKLAYCAPNMVESCPSNHNDAELNKRCSMYHGERKLKDEKLFFKNVHCAFCNGASLKDLECVGRNYSPKKQQTRPNTQKVIFDEGKWVELLGEERYKCSENFGYNPFWKKCRERKLIIYGPRYSGDQTLAISFALIISGVIVSKFLF